MDVDKAIQFLLESSARLDAQQARTDLEIEKTQRQLRAAVRLGTAISRRVFNSLDALAAAQRETDAHLRETDARLRDTDARLREVADGLDRLRAMVEQRWMGNGHGPRS